MRPVLVVELEIVAQGFFYVFNTLIILKIYLLIFDAIISVEGGMGAWAPGSLAIFLSIH
jgi:hypothetical protein